VLLAGGSSRATLASATLSCLSVFRSQWNSYRYTCVSTAMQFSLVHWRIIGQLRKDETIGWFSQVGGVNCARPSTVVYSTRLHHTWRICAYLSPTSPTGSTYIPLAASSSLFRATVVHNSAVGPSRWPGMLYRTPLETLPCQPVLSDVLWKLSSFLLTSVLAH